MLDVVVPCSCKIRYLPQVSCFFFVFFFRLTTGVWCPKQPGKLLCHVTHHHCNVMKCDFVTMNARFLPSTILNGIKYVK